MMIYNIMISKIFRISHRSTLINFSRKNLCTQTIRSFCKLPKPSRFSQQLGLHKQFEKTKINAQKSEYSNVTTLNFVIWGCLCIIGSFIVSIFVISEIRETIRMRYKLFVFSISPTDDGYSKILQQLINYQKEHLSNTLFSSSLSIDILKKCISKEILTNNHEQLQKYYSMLDEALKNNLNNKKNQADHHMVYKKYFQRLLNEKHYFQSPYMNVLISFLIKNADIQTLYLISLLKSNGVLSIDKKKQINIHEKLEKQKLEIQKTEDKLSQLRKQEQNLLLDPYQFECSLKRKWIKFIQQNFILQ